MFKLCTYIILFLFLAYTNTYACQFSTDIKENKDGTFTYTKECHIRVGKIINESYLLGDKIMELEKQLSLKDQIISNNEQRIQNWANTSTNLHKAILDYNRWSFLEKNVLFLSGFGLALLSVFVAAQVIK